MSTNPSDYPEFSADDPEAERRAKIFKDVDPFEDDIHPALLCAEHIKDYVRVTGLLHPFFPTSDRLKPASYEARPGGTFIRWDDKGKKRVQKMKAGEEETLELPPNSISFIQIDLKIRLPAYIGLRFNLRIIHVHRGLLLGTGPLIDPEWEGDLLIPLHNLTDQHYHIKQNEGLIWIEFTKTSRKSNNKVVRIESHKKNRGPEYYFEQANHNNPIRSSIAGAIKEYETRTKSAEKSAKRVERYIGILSVVGFITVAGFFASTLLSLHQYFGQIGSLAQGVQDKASTALGKVDQAVSGADDARKEAIEAKKEADETRKELEMLRVQVNELKADLQQRQSQVGSQPASAIQRPRR